MSASRAALAAAAVGLVLLLASSAPLAQTTSGTLVGTVRFERGDPVADAVVQARAVETGLVRTTVSDASGGYRLESLPPGSWTVVARLADGQPSESRTIELRLQEVVRLDFTVGRGVYEQVSVVAETPLVDPRETAGKLRVEASEIDRLPLAGRVVTDLAKLDSSVSVAAPENFIGERGAVFTLNGQSGRSNSFLVDGLDNNDQVSGTTQNAFYSQQVIEEFVLLTHQYSPEFGRASGGVMNIVTRRGANEPEWEVFAQGSSPGWNDPGEFVDALPDDGSGQDAVSRFQTGFRVGGPLRRDRAFYFLAYEHQRSDEVVPYVGIDRDGRPGGTLVAPSGDDNLFLRGDFNLSPSNTLMLRLSWDDRSTDGANVGGIYTPESGFRIDERDVSLAGSLTTIVSPRVINELRLLAASSEFEQFARSDRPGATRPSGVTGGNTLNRQLRDEDRLQLVENVTWIAGRHTLKLGMDVARSSTTIAARFNPNGNFLYDSDAALEPGDCGDLFLNEVLDTPEDELPWVRCPGVPRVDDDGDGDLDELANLDSYGRVFTWVGGEPEAVLDETKVAVFAQDRYKVSSKLLLDYGLRYDLSTYELPESARVDSPIPNGGASRDTDNLAPRLGFTFTPHEDGKLVLRGGAGVFYDKLVLGFPAVAAITSGTSIDLSFPQGFVFEIDENWVESHGIDATKAQLLIDDPYLERLVMRFSTAPSLETPYIVQANLGIERRVGAHGAVQAGVLRAQGYHLPLMKDLNPVSGLIPPGVDCTPGNIDPDLDYGGIPCHLGDPLTGSIAAITTEGRSWYTAVDLGYRLERADASLSTSYTWSKAEDLGFDPLKNGISLPPDSTNIAGERGRADGDRRHRLVVSGDTALPWFALRLSGVLQLASGAPFNVTTGTDDNLDGILSDRPPGVERNTGSATPLGAVNDVRSEAGLGPVTSLAEPSFAQFDLRVYRPFVWDAGRGSGVVFLQVINLLDRENPGLIEGRAVSPSFGEVTSLAGPPRTVEIGFRLGH